MSINDLATNTALVRKYLATYLGRSVYDGMKSFYNKFFTIPIFIEHLDGYEIIRIICLMSLIYLAEAALADEIIFFELKLSDLNRVTILFIGLFNHKISKGYFYNQKINDIFCNYK